MMRLSLIPVLLMLASPLQAQEAPQVARLLTVTGEGRAYSVPDMASLSAGIVTDGKTAAEALSANSKAMEDIVALLKAEGVEAADMQTSNLNLTPVWDNSKFSVAGAPMISGYQATNTLTIRVRDLDETGALLDKVVGVGANQLYGLVFGLTDQSPLLDKARKDAVAEAMRKAEMLASAAGVKVGKIVTIAESGGYVDPQPMFRSDKVMEAPVPTEPGEIAMTASVSMTFEIVE